MLCLILNTWSAELKNNRIPYDTQEMVVFGLSQCKWDGK